jgi:chorismate dehydratase
VAKAVNCQGYPEFSGQQWPVAVPEKIMLRFKIMPNSDHQAPAMVRLGAVSYLNSRPLIEDLAQLLPGSSIELDYPSRLADALANHNLDVALIPSIEYFRRGGYQIISDACVAARGEVMSVKLYCRVHPGAVKRIALDEGSRTSATLARIILAERYGAFPKSEPLSMDSMTSDSTADAVLLIGDRAMHAPSESFVEVMDLGQVWYEWTGLPFVFAMWVAHSDADVTGIATALSEARNRGVECVRRIAAEEAPKLNLTEETAFHYLTHNLHYNMTSAERSGLALFYELASRHNLVDNNANLVFSDFVTA